MNVNKIMPFKANVVYKANNKQDADYITKKRAYIDARTENLNDLSFVSLILAIGALALNNNGVVDSKRFSKFSKNGGLAFAALSAVTTIMSIAKKIKLSKEFDQMNQEK